MIRRPPRSTQSRSSAASDVYKRQSSGPPANRAGIIPPESFEAGRFHTAWVKSGQTVAGQNPSLSAVPLPWTSSEGGSHKKDAALSFRGYLRLLCGQVDN